MSSIGSIAGKLLLPLVFAAFAGTAALAGDAPKATPPPLRLCIGDDPCRVCKDCSACKYCDPKNRKGGSCGVLRDQNGKAAAERIRKRARR